MGIVPQKISPKTTCVTMTSNQPVRQFVYADTVAQAYEFIERIRNTLPDNLARLKFSYQADQSSPRIWMVSLPGVTGQAGIEAYQVSRSKTEFWFFDSYRTYDQPIGQPFADLVTHILAEHDRLFPQKGVMQQDSFGGPGQKDST